MEEVLRIAARLIQRFDRSTPPASYIHAVGGAFRSGGDEGFGKSKRGVLAAATAELLLADNASRPETQGSHPWKIARAQ